MCRDGEGNGVREFKCKYLRDASVFRGTMGAEILGTEFFLCKCKHL